MDITAVVKLVLKDAEKKREDYALSGATNDGGARHIEELVDFYRMGYDRIFPPAWEKYAKQYKRENDPEYKHYLKLKERFED